MRLIFTNSKGVSMDFCNTPNLTLYNFDGLQPTELTASTIRKAYTNGVVVNNTHRAERQVILNLALTAGRDNDKLRRNIYDLVGDKEAGKLRYIDDELDVYTEAYAEAPSVETWTLQPTMQLSFLCPSAFLKATSETVLEMFNSIPALQFPLTIKEGEGVIMGMEAPELSEYEIFNHGQASTGVKIVVKFSQDVNGFIVENKSNGDVLRVANSFTVNGTTGGFKTGDILTITTEIGEKGAILYREGAYYDLFSAIDYGNRWLRIERGRNVMRYAQGDDTNNAGMYVVVSFNTLYWGV